MPGCSFERVQNYIYEPQHNPAAPRNPLYFAITERSFAQGPSHYLPKQIYILEDTVDV